MRTVVHSVDEYVARTKPHEGEGHEEYRCDDPPARLLGKGCGTCGVEVVIPIHEFIATGDIARWQELTGKKRGGGD